MYFKNILNNIFERKRAGVGSKSRLSRCVCKAKKNYKCVYGHMLKKIRVGRSEIYFFLILFFITKLMFDGIKNSFLHLKRDI